ncbi:MAG: GH25 family lysozyme [Bacteroidia bacterium]
MKKQLLFISAFAFFGMGANAQNILGTDVYHGDDPITYSQVLSGGYAFAWHKATQGTTYTDPDFAGDMASGEAAGVYMGAYDFATPESNTAAQEADYFLSVAKSYIKACELPPALDLEDPSGGPALSSDFTSAQLTAWVQEWMDTIQKMTGITPVLYTDGNYANYLGSSLNKYPLWIATVSGSPGTVPSSDLKVWTTWTFNQYSWTATIPGIPSSNGAADADAFNGDTAAFKTFLGCITSPVTVYFTSNVTSGCPGMTVNFTDKSTSTGTITGWKWRFPGGSPSSSTAQNPTVTYSSSGTYNVTEVVTSTTGVDSITSVAYINVIASGTLPLAEDFSSSTFPPTGWTLNIPVAGDSTWELCPTTGYNSTQCMYFPANCGNASDIAGERQQIYTPVYSFAGVTNAEMSFEVAYEPSDLTSTPAYSDTLVVYYSTDCASTWTQIYSKGGATLCTTGSTTSVGTDVVDNYESRGDCFVPPNDAAWRKDSISLSALNGDASVMFSFECRSGWGNIMYLDNINISTGTITSIPNLVSSDDVKVYPNPNNGSFKIQSSVISSQLSVEIYDAFGQLVYHAPVAPGITQVNLDNKAVGVYFYRVITETDGRLISEGKLMIQ